MFSVSISHHHHVFKQPYTHSHTSTHIHTHTHQELGTTTSSSATVTLTATASPLTATLTSLRAAQNIATAATFTAVTRNADPDDPDNTISPLLVSWACDGYAMQADGSRGPPINCGSLLAILATAGATVNVPANTLTADVVYDITLTVSKADGRSASVTRTMTTFATTQAVVPTGSFRYGVSVTVVCCWCCMPTICYVSSVLYAHDCQAMCFFLGGVGGGIQNPPRGTVLNPLPTHTPTYTPPHPHSNPHTDWHVSGRPSAPPCPLLHNHLHCNSSLTNPPLSPTSPIPGRAPPSPTWVALLPLVLKRACWWSTHRARLCWGVACPSRLWS